MRAAPSPHRAGFVAALRMTAAAAACLAALAGCKGDLDEDARNSPAAVALAASAPAVTTDKVPAPPVLVAPPAAAASSGDLAAVHAQLEALLGKASACSADTECRSVATGAKACGGPTGYRAYSATRADPAQVAALAQREHDLGMAQARQSGGVSACFMLADPGAHCEQHRCVTGPADAH
jgi:hypothetical protein